MPTTINDKVRAAMRLAGWVSPEEVALLKAEIKRLKDRDKVLASSNISDDEILDLFKKFVGGEYGAWAMYRAELIAFYRSAIAGQVGNANT